MEAEHDRVDVPEPPAMLVEDRLQARFVEFVVTARVTVLVKPLMGVTVMVEVAEIPVSTETVVGLAVTLKFGTALTW
jgi:hypothetical protein